MGLQRDWRWCFKCQGLYFFGNPSKGVCAADRSAHSARDSGQYAVHLNQSPIPGQGGWKWCSKCQGLFFTGGGSLGKCAADNGSHAAQGSGETSSSPAIAAWGRTDGAGASLPVALPRGHWLWRLCRGRRPRAGWLR